MSFSRRDTLALGAGAVALTALPLRVGAAATVDEVVAAHVQTPVTPPHQVIREVSKPTSDALVIALAKNPDERYQSYDDFIMALTSARSQLLVNQLRSGRSGGWWRR